MLKQMYMEASLFLVQIQALGVSHTDRKHWEPRIQAPQTSLQTYSRSTLKVSSTESRIIRTALLGIIHLTVKPCSWLQPSTAWTSNELKSTGSAEVPCIRCFKPASPLSHCCMIISMHLTYYWLSIPYPELC